MFLALAALIAVATAARLLELGGDLVYGLTNAVAFVEGETGWTFAASLDAILVLVVSASIAGSTLLREVTRVLADVFQWCWAKIEGRPPAQLSPLHESDAPWKWVMMPFAALLLSVAAIRVERLL